MSLVKQDDNTEYTRKLLDTIVYLQNTNIILEKKLLFYKEKLKKYQSIECTNTIPPLSVYSLDFLHNYKKNTDFLDIVLCITKKQYKAPIIQIEYSTLLEMVKKKSYMIESYIMTGKYAIYTKIQDIWVWLEEKIES